jgi:hypothetical protein
MFFLYKSHFQQNLRRYTVDGGVGALRWDNAPYIRIRSHRFFKAIGKCSVPNCVRSFAATFGTLAR